MKNKRSLFLILVLIVTMLVGCSSSNETNSGYNKLNASNEDKEIITIIMSNQNTINTENVLVRGKEVELYNKLLYLYIGKFTQETGIEVNFLRVNSNNYEEYLQNRNTQLYLDGGPTLILIGAGESYESLVKEGVALEVGDKIDNYKNIYEPLKDGFYVPMAIAADTRMLNKKALERLNIDIPTINWTQKDFTNIMYKFYDEDKTYIVPETIETIINSKLGSDISLLNESGKSEVASQETVEIIENIRYELMESGKFKIREDYKYENYYNMMFGLVGYELSKEDNDLIEAWKEISVLNPNVWLWRSVNILNALETYKNKSLYLFVQNNGGPPLDRENMIILPSPDNNYYSWGFILNKNGKNVEGGLRFLDYLLSDEAQLRIYTEMDDKHDAHRAYSFSYPVVKTIEDEILDIEMGKKVDEHLINVRKEVLKQIEAGDRTRMYSDEREELLKEKLKRIIVKVVFSDEKYSSERIMKELKEFDNEMNLMFSE